LSAVDYGLMLAYAAALLFIGMRSSTTHPTADDLTLGRRSLPGWAVLCSMSATELSAATFIGVPHVAYTGDWSYLQLAVGALLAKLLLARYVIPLYHRRRVVTVYGVLGERFGDGVQRAAAASFIAGRILASGVRLFIAALALASVSEIPIEAAIVCSGVVAGIYTLSGGIRAVVWTDTMQGALFLIAALATLGVLASHADGGLGGILQWAGDAGRSRVLHMDPLFSIADGQALGVALIGAFFLTLATHATDHDMVQRLLATKDGRSGGRALLGSALLNFPLTLLFLLIGTGLAHFYAEAPAYDISDTPRILPLFALHELPAGLRGLLFAGLFAAAMSSLDSAVCAISTCWVNDVLPTPAADEDSDARTVRSLRRASIAFTALLIGAAILMANYHRLLVADAVGHAGPSLVDFALSSMGILYGGLAGVFATALLTRRRGNARSALAGLAGGAALGLALFLHPLILGHNVIAWPWWIPLCSGLSFLIAAAPAGGRAGASSSA